MCSGSVCRRAAGRFLAGGSGSQSGAVAESSPCEVVSALLTVVLERGYFEITCK